MIYTIAHLFRKNSLSRSEFSDYYETHHTRLAQRLLPEFSHYRRNHVLESTDVKQCPDSFSEFGYDQPDKLLATMTIVGDARGRELMEDELQFMDKARNQIYPVVQLGQMASHPFAHKYLVVVRGAATALETWLAAWQVSDAGLLHTMAYSELGGAAEQQLHWLMGWSSELLALAELQEQLRKANVPVLWCARVDECSGYPGK